MRRHGVAFDLDEVEAGVRCIAAGIRDDSGELIAKACRYRLFPNASAPMGPTGARDRRRDLRAPSAKPSAKGGISPLAGRCPERRNHGARGLTPFGHRNHDARGWDVERPSRDRPAVGGKTVVHGARHPGWDVGKPRRRRVGCGSDASRDPALRRRQAWSRREGCNRDLRRSHLADTDTRTRCAPRRRQARSRRYPHRMPMNPGPGAGKPRHPKVGCGSDASPRSRAAATTGVVRRKSCNRDLRRSHGKTPKAGCTAAIAACVAPAETTTPGRVARTPTRIRCRATDARQAVAGARRAGRLRRSRARAWRLSSAARACGRRSASTCAARRPGRAGGRTWRRASRCCRGGCCRAAARARWRRNRTPPARACIPPIRVLRVVVEADRHHQRHEEATLVDQRDPARLQHVRPAQPQRPRSRRAGRPRPA